MDYEIITDLSVDIDADIARKYGLKYMPMQYRLGEEEYPLDHVLGDEELNVFYEKLRNKVPTSTSQINSSAYIDLFRPYAKNNIPVLFFSLSSGLSDTFNSANVAIDALKEEYPDLKIVIYDTLSATIGTGMIIEAAFCNKKKGLSLEENVSALKALQKNVKVQFMVSDLFYLMRGGRVSVPTAALGSALNLRPILIINNEGRLQTVAKKRGDKLALKELAQMFQNDHDGSFFPELANRIMIVHGGCPDKAAALANILLEINPKLNIFTCCLNPVIGAHTGADMVGLVFIGKEWN